MKRTLLLAFVRSLVLLGVVMLLAAKGSAHPGKTGGHEHEDEKNRAPSAEQTEKRLKRVIKRAEERKAKRKQRQKDRRKALRKRVQRHLRGGSMTDDVRQELTLHAKRRARLRQIRYTAAKKGDYETVVASDKVLARENARHVAFWRKRDMRRRTGKLDAGKGAAK